MKWHRCLVNILIASLAFLSWGGSPVRAQDISASPDAPSAGGAVVIPHPDVSQVNIPAGLGLASARSLAGNLVAAQTRALARQFSVEKTGAQPTELEGGLGLSLPPAGGANLQPLGQSAGLGAVTPVLRDAGDCSRRSLLALSREILDRSRLKAYLAARPAAVLAPTVKIRVSYPNPDGWTLIFGWTDGSTPVTLQILRQGKQVVSQTTQSDPQGNYSFSPTWSQSGCAAGASLYDWTVQAGDIVKVTARGITASTTVARISFWVDPKANTIEGMTEPGRNLEVDLLYTGNSYCEYRSLAQDLTSDVNGHFLASWGKQVDFNNRAFSNLWVNDGGGNFTFAAADAFSLDIFPGWGSIEAVIKPATSYTFTQVRAGSTLETHSGISASDGSIQVSLVHSIQPGDNFQLSGGGLSQSFSAHPLSLSADAAADQVKGTTDARRPVVVNFVRRTAGAIVTSCAYNSDCLPTTADSSGKFSVADKILNPLPGDEVGAYLYESNGNFQYAEVSFPAVVVDPALHSVRGYWQRYDLPLTVTWQDSLGSVKQVHTGIQASGYGGYFSYGFDSGEPTPGDQVVVTDGIASVTMTVQGLTGILQNKTGHLTGTATTGSVLAVLDGTCSMAAVQSGGYDFNYQSYAIRGWDAADVYAPGPDGQYTYHQAYSFSASLDLTREALSGYTPTPQALVTVQLYAGDSLLSNESLQSDPGGYYLIDLPDQLLPGRHLTVSSSDGASSTVNIPDLTVQADKAQNRVWGAAPAGQPLSVSLSGGSGFQSVTLPGSADQAGQYSVSFAGAVYPDCEPAQAGASCSLAVVQYSQADGQIVKVWNSLIPPDGFEAGQRDDTPGTAKPYAGYALHNFDSYADIDWISFDVTADLLGKPLYLETFAPGQGIAIDLALYSADGQTRLAGNGPEYRSISRIEWVPQAAGTYLIRVAPSGLAYLTCRNGMYSLFVYPNINFLPLVSR